MHTYNYACVHTYMHEHTNSIYHVNLMNYYHHNNHVCICYCKSSGVIMNLFHIEAVWYIHTAHAHKQCGMQCEPKWKRATMSAKIRVFNLKKRRLSLSFSVVLVLRKELNVT